MSQPVEIQCSTDASQVTERLRHIAHLFAGYSNFFGEHPQVVGVGEDIVEMRKGKFAQIWNVDVVGCRLVTC